MSIFPKRRYPMKSLLVFVAALALSGFGAYAAGTGCVACHTSAETMKSLFVPPVLAEAEGEG
jgi:hypothetical protein